MTYCQVLQGPARAIMGAGTALPFTSSRRTRTRLRAGLRILFRQTGDSPGRSICAPVISPAGNRSHGLRDRVWPTGRGTVCQLFFLATAALRTVANAVHAISGTASAAAV